jgi:small subunit ribosomal protein S4e
MHKKLSEMPVEWPLPRKGRAYVGVANHDSRRSMTIITAVRDILEIAKTEKEVRRICLDGSVKINQKIRTDAKFPILLGDVLSLEKIKKTYRLQRQGKRFIFKEISSEDGTKKIVRIIGKKVLKGNRLQANLEDGRNTFYDKKFSCGDSAMVDLTANKVIKIIPLESGARISIVSGRHVGQFGKVKEVRKEAKKNVYLISLEGGKEAQLTKDVLRVVE